MLRWFVPALKHRVNAEVAELVDALASGASGGNPVEVQVLSSVPVIKIYSSYIPR